MTDPAGRRELFKEIWRCMRKELRSERTARTCEIFSNFGNLSNLACVHHQPVVRSHQCPDFHKCAKLLADVYRAEYPQLRYVRAAQGTDINPFSTEEVWNAVRSMSKKKTADRKGIMLEMFLHGGDQMLSHLTEVFNEIVHTGQIPNGWRKSFFQTVAQRR